MLALESPHRGNSNKKGPKNEFETAMVNEPSVFEPLKFYCNYFFYAWSQMTKE